MAAVAAFILAAAANVADLPQQAPSAVSASASATVTIIRAERVNALAEMNAASRSVRREAGTITVDFY